MQVWLCLCGLGSVGCFDSTRPRRPCRGVNAPVPIVHDANATYFILWRESSCMDTVPEDAKARFWDKVDIGSADECWEWQAAIRNDYGLFSVNGTSHSAHRVAFALDEGEPPEQLVLHKCDNKVCCNPRHLYDGDGSDNMNDWFDRQDAGQYFEGEENPNAKLTESEVKEIKRMLGEYSTGEIAGEFGVHPSTISNIKSGYNWADVTPE